MKAATRSLLLLPLFAGMVASLSACAPSTAGGVRKMGVDRQFSFVAQEGYQPVYRKVLEQSRKCYQQGLITAQMAVQGDIYHDTKSGSITVTMHGGLGDNHVFQVYDVSAIDETQTKVVGYFSVGPVTQYGQTLKEWVLDNSEDCRPKV